MKVEILSPNKKIYKGEARGVVLPAKEGEIQILENHAPLFALLKEGKIVLDNGKEFFISSGIAQVQNNELTILIKE